MNKYKKFTLQVSIHLCYLHQDKVRMYAEVSRVFVNQCRRKGQLLEDDIERRLKFAHQCKNLPEIF